MIQDAATHPSHATYPNADTSDAQRPRAADRVQIMGVGVDPLTESQTIRTVLDGVAAGRGGWVCPVNLDVLRKVVTEPGSAELVAEADLVVSDGMPLLWAARLQGTPLPDRVSGSSLIHTLPAAAAPAGASVFLLGGDDGVAEQAAERLRAQYPGLEIVGTHCPPVGFERSPRAMREIKEVVAAARPDVVFVALGFPKQERLIRHLRQRLPEAWWVSCGISLSFVTGDVSRAPRWVQRAGLEWLHRLAQEPRRLARRYLVDGMPFMARLMLDSARRR
jgi:N-acetylglucosaminyldiphosphoundecaprenol N-acetyl-beta-D-mannosaminyltransferase